MSSPAHSLLIGVPCYPPSVSIHHYFSGLRTLALLLEQRLPCAITAAADCALVGHARADLVAQFLATDATHLLMVDADVGWEPGDVLRLLDHNVPLVSAVQIDKHRHTLFLSGKEGSSETEEFIRNRYDPTTQLIRVDRAATCFMLIRRDVIERMIEAYPTHKVTPGRFGTPGTAEHFYGFFEQPVRDDGTWPGEDIQFCELWRAIGGELYVDPWVTLMHVVRKPIAGNLALSLGLSKLEEVA